MQTSHQWKRSHQGACLSVLSGGPGICLQARQLWSAGHFQCCPFVARGAPSFCRKLWLPLLPPFKLVPLWAGGSHALHRYLTGETEAGEVGVHLNNALSLVPSVVLKSALRGACWEGRWVREERASVILVCPSWAALAQICCPLPVGPP